MKTTSTLFAGIVALLVSGSLLAQNNINLEIVHKLSGDDFQFNQASQNNQQQKFDVSRLEYYISEISITHDGGQQTAFDSLWVLANASTTTSVLLGNANITTVESISFSIGIDPAHNHLDPSAWPSTHPLAPKNPSMHWGWTSGYRFVAMEGNAGDNLNQSYELHALGDNNYFQATVDADGVVIGNVVTVTLYANYAEALRDIDVSPGLILHGETGEAKDLLENFRDHVFSSEEPVDSLPDSTTSVGVTDIRHRIAIAPNPALNGTIQVLANGGISGMLHIEVLDITGKTVYTGTISPSANRLDVSGLKQGVYFLRMHDQESENYLTQKVSVL